MTLQSVRLAIVGSTAFANDPAATNVAVQVIDAALDHYQPDTVISGGAKGIDSLARQRAERRGIHVVEHLPDNPRWKPDGYEDRNRIIATTCTHLLAIRHYRSKTYGSGWTADRAEEHGATVHRRHIQPDGTVTRS